MHDLPSIPLAVVAPVVEGAEQHVLPADANVTPAPPLDLDELFDEIKHDLAAVPLDESSLNPHR